MKGSCIWNLVLYLVKSKTYWRWCRSFVWVRIRYQMILDPPFWSWRTWTCNKNSLLKVAVLVLSIGRWILLLTIRLKLGCLVLLRCIDIIILQLNCLKCFSRCNFPFVVLWNPFSLKINYNNIHLGDLKGDKIWPNPLIRHKSTGIWPI